MYASINCESWAIVHAHPDPQAVSKLAHIELAHVGVQIVKLTDPAAWSKFSIDALRALYKNATGREVCAFPRATCEKQMHEMALAIPATQVTPLELFLQCASVVLSDPKRYSYAPGKQAPRPQPNTFEPAFAKALFDEGGNLVKVSVATPTHDELAPPCNPAHTELNCACPNQPTDTKEDPMTATTKTTPSAVEVAAADAAAKAAKDKAAAKAAKEKAVKDKAAAAKAAKEKAVKDKADAKAAKEKAVKDKADAKAAKESSRMPENNGILRPRPDGTCGKAWALFDNLSSAKGSPVAIADAKVATRAASINDATTQTQFARWRKFHGISAR